MLCLLAVGKWAFEEPRALFGRAAWYAIALIVGVALVHGIVARGVFRRRPWAYYFSLVLYAYWGINSAYDFFAPPLTKAPRGFSVMLFVLAAVALAWLISPALRSQFPLGFGKTKVA